MDDLDVIRLAVIDNIARERIARARMESKRFDAGACARKRHGEDDGIDESEGIGGMRLSWIDVDPFMAGERRGVKPCAVGKERVAAEIRNGGFQMKAAGGGNGDDFVLVGRKNGGKLADAFRVAAPGEADGEVSAHAKDVATFERAGKANLF